MPRVQSAKSTAAKTRAVAPKKSVDVREIEAAKENDVQFVQGQRQELGGVVEVENNLDNLKQKAERLAFMEEPVTINIAEGTEKNAEKFVFLAVNGVGAGPHNIPWVPRGQDVVVKRKFVNVLLNARAVRYKNEEIVDQKGVRQNVQRAYVADIYPFQVVEDTARGRDWLRLMRSTRRAG